MSTPTPDGVTRRAALRTGGLTLGLGALLAACGSGRTGGTDPGRLGVAPPAPTLPEVAKTPDDLTVLRTAQSLEHTVVDVHSALINTGEFTSEQSALAERLIAGHLAHSETLSALIGSAGGAPYACAHPFLVERVVTPLLAQISGSDDPARDVLNIAHGFEAMLGASYQAFVGMLGTGELRRAAAQLGATAHRHAAVVALAVNPDEPFAPTFFGEPIEPTSDGTIVVNAIPGVFGRLAGIDVVVGARNDDGQRYATQLQTPAPNSFVYEYMSCG